MKNTLNLILFFSLSLGACSARQDSSQPGPLDQIESDSTANRSSVGSQLARAALTGNLGYSASRCYEYVWKALRSVLGYEIEATSVPARSAYQFGDWADRNPSELLRIFKLKKSSVYPEKAPLGSVIVWNPGQCGYSGAHGHIEIAVGNGKACSDFCGPIATHCSLPRIYVPTSSSANGFTSSTCQADMLEICLRYKGGNACYAKWGCSK